MSEKHVSIPLFPISNEEDFSLVLLKRGKPVTLLQVSTGISSDVPIVVERPMYFNYGIYDGGHDVVGYAS